jgi:hypothetical protein
VLQVKEAGLLVEGDADLSAIATIVMTVMMRMC